MRLLLLLLSVSLALPLCAQNATTPGAITDEIPTCNCLGFRWAITGDADLDCSVGVEYRVAGSATWLAALPLLRVEPAATSGNDFDPGNLLAGSVIGLSPDTEYEVRLSLADADGGSSVQTRSLRTRAVPADPAAPRTRYVMPGSGGGTGSQADPFKGLAAAQAAAAPGDVFLLAAGTYTHASTFSFSVSGTSSNPIVWRGVDAATVVVDGAGTAQPLLAFPGTQYVHLENLTVRKPLRTAISGTATRGLVVRRCRIDCSAVSPTSEAGGILLQGAGHESAFISENTLQGNADWSSGRGQDSYACTLVGRGHVVRFNEFYDWWDSAGFGGNDNTVDTSGCDFIGNECHEITDDGIELDSSRCNLRVLANRFTNVLCGISAQPLLAGPAIIARNVVYNCQLKPLKFHPLGTTPKNTPTGLQVFNNTFVGADERGFGGGDWRHGLFRNNLFVGSNDAGAIAFDTIAARYDWDYNGWYQSPAAANFGRIGSTTYATLAAFRTATGQETHGLLVTHGVFVNAPVPTRSGTSYPFATGFGPAYGVGSANLALAAGTNSAVDAGVALPNITDGFAGAAPDLGACERGSSQPAYGPAGAGSGGGGGGGGGPVPPGTGGTPAAAGGGGGSGCNAGGTGAGILALLLLGYAFSAQLLKQAKPRA
ncbi:MAG: right-handed parallel beta-helix repeat-containing protein [Planctomycetes bacterium]|nr:right-handed parallel beta-helix repeat-containing protein [Planctomycetota bacterium]